MQYGYRNAVTAASEQGVAIGSSGSHWGGWPVAAEVVLDQARLRGAADMFPPGLAWSADRLRLRLSARHPESLQLRPEGRQTIAAAGLPTVPFQAGALTVVVDLTGRDPVWAFTKQLELSLPAGPARVESGSVILPPQEVVLSLSGVTLPGVAAPIETVRGRASVEPAFPVAATAAAAAASWRAAGGRLTLDGVQLVWDGLDATLAASGGLDPSLQPEGSGNVTVTGLAPFLDRLVALGAMPASSAVAAKAVYAVLAAPSGGGPVSLPITLRGGVVSLARFPLLRLAPVAWE